MRVTQQEIATRAGVSQTAVSMILRGNKTFTCSAEVRRKVLSVARQCGYKVPRRRTFNLGLQVSSLVDESIRSHTYYYRFFHGMVDRAATLGYHLLVEQDNPSEDLPETVQAHKVDGLIIQQCKFHGQRVARLSAVLPIVMMNCLEQGANAASVLPDNENALAQCVAHLHALGHRRIAYFGLPGPPVGSMHAAERQAGFLKAMRDHDLSVPPEYLQQFEAIPSGNDELDRLVADLVAHYRKLAAPPTAVLSNGDAMILPFMRAAAAAGWRIPGDVSVIGFDNVEACEHSDPPLSSIDQPMEEMAAAAIDELVGRIEDPDRVPRCLRFPLRLVLRDSTARPPANN